MECFPPHFVKEKLKEANARLRCAFASFDTVGIFKRNNIQLVIISSGAGDNHIELGLAMVVSALTFAAFIIFIICCLMGDDVDTGIRYRKKLGAINPLSSPISSPAIFA